jgi:hypothetical protein
MHPYTYLTCRYDTNVFVLPTFKNHMYTVLNITPFIENQLVFSWALKVVSLWFSRKIVPPPPYAKHKSYLLGFTRDVTAYHEVWQGL